MRTRSTLVILALFFITVLSVAAWYIATHDIAILHPQGEVAEGQLTLLRFTAILSLIIVVPVFALTFFIVWRYREGNAKAVYAPDWHGNIHAEATWWLIPLLLIGVLAVITWRSSHVLDPFRPLQAANPPLRVQVVALRWKWLFIYPEQRIATVNYLRIPQDTPINLEVTADAPMNSLWIPRLAGQVYAMAGMSTQLHVMTDGPGTFQGSSANLSGEGFAGMRFAVTSIPRSDFAAWVGTAQSSPQNLDASAYASLAEPSKNVVPATYALGNLSLYDTVIQKYAMPHDDAADTMAMPGSREGEN